MAGPYVGVWPSCWCSPAPIHAAPEERCFSETGRCIAGRFLAYWDAHGGLALNGHPLTPERRELLEDGQESTVQYFERVRMELHPENAPPFDVLLGQFGREAFRETFGFQRYQYEEAIAPSPPQAGLTYFVETGHNVGPRFLAYWAANGGLAQFGHPLGEERDEALDDGQTSGLTLFRVQYFEYHPEHAGTPYDVLLGQFGRAGSTRGDNIAAPYASLYRNDAQLRSRVGGPLVTGAGPGGGRPIVSDLPGEYLPFEHGMMVRFRWPGGEPNGVIQVLCGRPDDGTALVGSRLVLGLPDSWNSTLPVGGGPGPRPGTYAPKYGFGMLWQGQRDCLGYATSPDATIYQPQNQYFSRGFLCLAPDGTGIYALYTEADKPGPLTGYYRRYPTAR